MAKGFVSTLTERKLYTALATNCKFTLVAHPAISQILPAVVGCIYALPLLYTLLYIYYALLRLYVYTLLYIHLRLNMNLFQYYTIINTYLYSNTFILKYSNEEQIKTS
jgi:hypothetical protein